MKSMKRIPIILNGGGIEATAYIVDELPTVGSVFKNRFVREIFPYPLTWADQKVQEVWQYAIWSLHLSDDAWEYVAIHEPESETM